MRCPQSHLCMRRAVFTVAAAGAEASRRAGEVQPMRTNRWTHAIRWRADRAAWLCAGSGPLWMEDENVGRRSTRLFWRLIKGRWFDRFE